MCFVGNHGTIQIHTGTVKNLQPMGPWLNVMDPTFHMHLRMDHIAEFRIDFVARGEGILGIREPESKLVDGLRQMADFALLDVDDWEIPLLRLADDPGALRRMAEVGAIRGRQGKMEGLAHVRQLRQLGQHLRGNLGFPEHLAVGRADDAAVVASEIIVADTVMLELRHEHAVVAS